MDERCRDQLAFCNKRFESGSKSFARIETEIRHLQERDTMINGTSRDNKLELTGRVKDLEKKVESIEQSANRILAGIAVACILMVINIFVG